MPIDAREVANFNAYVAAVGADNGAPVGTHLTEVVKADVRTNENSGLPTLNLQCKIQDGEHENENIFVPLAWFVSETDRDGEAKVPAKMKSGTKFVRQQAEFFAKRLEREADDEAARVERAFRIAFSRAPTPEEREKALEFLKLHDDPHAALKNFCHTLFNASEFLFID